MRHPAFGTLLVLTSAIVGAAAGLVLADDAGGGGVNEYKTWDCQLTGCGVAGNGACPRTQSMCCCSNGASPPAYVAACADPDCGGSSLCQACQ